MKYNSIVLVSLCASVCYAAEQMPNFNLKNKSDKEIVLVIGTQSTEKKPVFMRIKDAKAHIKIEGAYTPGESILMGGHDSVSLYGLFIEKVTDLEVYFDIDVSKWKKQARLKASFQDTDAYSTLYLKFFKKNRFWITSQEGSLGNKTTDGYSLKYNIADDNIRMQFLIEPKFVVKDLKNIKQDMQDRFRGAGH